jgi:hypothetical protein
MFLGIGGSAAEAAAPLDDYKQLSSRASLGNKSIRRLGASFSLLIPQLL